MEDEGGAVRHARPLHPSSLIPRPSKEEGVMGRHKSEKRRERGSVLAMGALGMLTFLLATGLAVDIGHFYLVKSELQNAADASALAGASALNSGLTGITEATKRAKAAMNSYEFNSKPLDIVNVKFAVNLDGPYMDAGSVGSAV